MAKWWMWIGLMVTLVGLTGCSELPKEPDTSQRFIVGALRVADSVQCRALSYEGVVWQLRDVRLGFFMEQLRSLRGVPRQVPLRNQIRKELETLLQVNDSDASIQRRALPGDFSRMLRLIEQLDATAFFDTERLTDAPDTVVVAIDLVNNRADIVHISQLTLDGVPTGAPQPLVREVLDVLRLAQ